jgi:N-acetylglutamate synthase-like GNAT family acetyltransferase
MFDLRYLYDKNEFKALISFLSYPLDYPGYDEWSQRCQSELEIGIKKSFAIFESNSTVAATIFQAKKDNSSILEIKSFFVSEDYIRIGLGSRLENKVTAYARWYGYNGIMVDTHSQDAIEFFLNRGYIVKSREELYRKNQVETIMLKWTT